MKKNTRVIQINGFRGLLLAIFTVCCLAAGFVAFPALISMHIWNFLALKTGSFPPIQFGEGVLLWGIIAFSFYLFTKKKFIVSFNSQNELSEDEIKEVMSKIQTHSKKTQSIMPKDISSDIMTNGVNAIEENKIEQK